MAHDYPDKEQTNRTDGGEGVSRDAQRNAHRHNAPRHDDDVLFLKE